MKLVLTSGEKISVNRLNCGYEEGNSASGSRNWNISPTSILKDGSKKGAFVIAKWGSRVSDSFEKFIPVRNVVYVEDDGIPYESYQHNRGGAP
jgi:hypothetical protein